MSVPSETGLPPAGPDVRASDRQILLFGEVLADQFPDGERIGGAPFNVARHLQAFGLRPRLISRIGTDPLGQRLLTLMTGWGMDASGIQRDPERPTGRVRVHMETPAHRFEILPDQAYDHIEVPSADFQARPDHPALLYFGTLVQRSAKVQRALQALLRSVPSPRFLDLNLRPPWYERGTVIDSLAAADVLKLNREELSEVADLLGLPAASRSGHAAELVARFTLRAVLVTEGAEGAWLLDAQGRESRSAKAITPAEVVDTVGAGDAFSAVFMLGMIRRWPPSITLERANAFAGALCGVRGAVPQEDAFYRTFLNDWRETTRGGAAWSRN